MQKPLLEALKEALRLVLLSVLPVVILQVETGVFDTKVLLTLATVAALRALDKFVHEWGKETGDANLEKGITRF